MFRLEGSISGCFNCSSGSVANRTDSSGCSVCSPGSYATNSSCVLCSAGTWSPGNTTSCSDCAIGSFSNHSGTVSCDLCPSGSFGVKSAASSQDEACQLCPSGTFQSQQGLTECVPCDQGTYNPSAGAISNSSCIPCPRNTYSTSLNVSSISLCSACPNNTFTYSIGAKNVSECVSESVLICSLGWYRNATECVPCPTGTFATGTGDSVLLCEACPIGYFSNVTGSTSCSQCTAGYFTNTTGASLCASCAPGSFSNSSALSSCFSCGRGYSSNEGSSSQSDCFACPEGFYGPQEKNVNCLACPTRTTSGLASESCESCAAKFFLNGTQCIPCPMDHVCAVGSLSPVPNIMNGAVPSNLLSRSETLTFWKVSKSNPVREFIHSTLSPYLEYSLLGFLLISVIFLIFFSSILFLICIKKSSFRRRLRHADFLFSYSRHIPEGSLLFRQKSYCGAFCTLITLIFVIVCCLLTTVEYISGNYIFTETVIPQNPVKMPSGNFALIVSALVDSLQDCNGTVLSTGFYVDTNSQESHSFSLSQDTSGNSLCTAKWKCTGSCSLDRSTFVGGVEVHFNAPLALGFDYSTATPFFDSTAFEMTGNRIYCGNSSDANRVCRGSTATRAYISLTQLRFLDRKNNYLPSLFEISDEKLGFSSQTTMHELGSVASTPAEFSAQTEQVRFAARFFLGPNTVEISTVMTQSFLNYLAQTGSLSLIVYFVCQWIFRRIDSVFQRDDHQRASVVQPKETSPQALGVVQDLKRDEPHFQVAEIASSAQVPPSPGKQNDTVRVVESSQLEGNSDTQPLLHPISQIDPNFSIHVQEDNSMDPIQFVVGDMEDEDALSQKLKYLQSAVLTTDSSDQEETDEEEEEIHEQLLLSPIMNRSRIDDTSFVSANDQDMSLVESPGTPGRRLLKNRVVDSSELLSMRPQSPQRVVGSTKPPLNVPNAAGNHDSEPLPPVLSRELSERGQQQSFLAPRRNNSLPPLGRAPDALSPVKRDPLKK